MAEVLVSCWVVQTQCGDGAPMQRQAFANEQIEPVNDDECNGVYDYGDVDEIVRVGNGLVIVG